MTTLSASDRVRAMLAEHLGADADKVTADARLIDDLCADSLDNIELVMAAEETFDIEIGDQEAEAVITVADAVALVERKLAEAA